LITLKKTPLNDVHKRLGAKLVEFSGFEMPIQYKGIIHEHNSVRNHAGIFDVSHMGEFIVSGIDAEAYLNYLVPNNIEKLATGQKGLYTQICNERGGVVDDLIIYKRDNDYLVVVNASNIKKDWDWFNKHRNNYKVELKDTSDETALIALQGPKAEKILTKILNIDLSNLNYFEIKRFNNLWIARTGYTGEDGFEIFANNFDLIVDLWNKLITASVVPCGLGARDTLRLEATYPLYGHELNDDTSPLEAGLGWSVKLDKSSDFIGKETLINQKENGISKKHVCLKIDSKLIARQGYKIYSKETEIGHISSGSQGITVGFPIATAYVPPEYAEIEKELSVEIRDKLVPAQVVKRPFYKRQI